MRILIISQPVWVNENNSGNTLSNFFDGFDAEFAEIYFSEGIPNNTVCDEYFQVTDKMVLERLLFRKPIGNRFTLSKIEKNQSSTFSFEAHGKRFKSFYLSFIREIIWRMVKVDNEKMYQFIRDFHPDLIYAPTFGNLRMLRIIRNIKRHTNLPLVSFISDDLYSYKSSMKTPLRLFYHLILRSSLRKSFLNYDLCYTMTEEQAKDCKKIYPKEMKVVRKSGRKNRSNKIHRIQSPIKLIYAGGIYLGRDFVLSEIANVITRINRVKKQFELHVYTSDTSNTLTGNNHDIYVHSAISYQVLEKVYQESDIALHVESFDKIYSDETRFSFSTKIVDCLQSGLPILALCPENNAGFRYLKKEDAAKCISSISEIETALYDIIDNYELFQKKAYDCLCRNHDAEINQLCMLKDFERIIRDYNL